MTTHVLVCTQQPAPTCPPEAQTFVPVDEAFTPQALGVDAATIGQTFAWGFGVVIFMWSLGYGVGVALKLVRAL